MKRYRVIPGYWDGRSILLRSFKGKLPDPGSPNESAVRRILTELHGQFGANDFPEKLDRYLELAEPPMSIVNEHNRLLSDCRNAYVAGFFYSALVGACALGERVLNSIILSVRDSFKSTPQYKKVYKKKSFDDWAVPIQVLEAWKIFDSTLAAEFYDLRDLRNESIHYNKDLQANLKSDSLKALQQVSKAMGSLFSAHGKSPFLHFGNAFTIIKKAEENHPIVKAFYIPNCIHVGPKHLINNMNLVPWGFEDMSEHSDIEISDDEYMELYEQFIKEHHRKS
jgi:hypothetical protein